MSEEKNKKIVREFFEYFSSGDAERALDLLDDNASWRAMGKEGGLPMSGEMNKESIGGLIGAVKEAIPNGLKLTPTGWTAEGEKVALETESFGELTNGKIYNNHYHFLALCQEVKSPLSVSTWILITLKRFLLMINKLKPRMIIGSPV